MKTEELVKSLADLIKNGLNMDNYNTFECNLFMKNLSEFLNARSPFNAHYTGNKITIESIFFDPMLSVELEKTTLHCIPITDDGWIDALFEVIKFVHIEESERNEQIKKKKKQKEKDSKEFDWI